MTFSAVLALGRLAAGVAALVTHDRSPELPSVCRNTAPRLQRLEAWPQNFRRMMSPS
jgi:hypothetical protein